MGGSILIDTGWGGRPTPSEKIFAFFIFPESRRDCPKPPFIRRSLL
jgi:hypothetical protein